MSNPHPHVSVLLNEVVQAFASTSIHTFLDGTVGAGGHAEAILKVHPEIELYVGIDQDPDALAIAAERLKPWTEKVRLVRGNFADFDTLVPDTHFDGILVDLGVSSMQLDRPEKGFSFSQEGPLDMRMDPASALTAAEIVNNWTEQELGKIFRDYGEEKQWRKAAQAIIAARKQKPILTTKELADVLNAVLFRNYKKGINPLTLIFQALRIATNRELDRLEIFMDKAIDHLAPKGRLAVISFHSLEDRIVKTHLRFQASDKWETAGIGGMFRDKQPVVRCVTKKPTEPGQEEMLNNPRSRSAKLRIAEKLG